MESKEIERYMKNYVQSRGMIHFMILPPFNQMLISKLEPFNLKKKKRLKTNWKGFRSVLQG